MEYTTRRTPRPYKISRYWSDRRGGLLPRTIWTVKYLRELRKVEHFKIIAERAGNIGYSI